MVQWLRLHAPNAGSPGSISGQGTRSHVLQPRVCMSQLKILLPSTKMEELHATTKTWHGQINKYFQKESRAEYGKR